jgi:hypothetical protein
MTPEEARDQLSTIRGVMNRARVERNASGIVYVVWGLVLVICIAATLGGDAAGWPYGWVAFPVLCTLTGAWTGIRARSKGLRRESYGGRIEGVLWGTVWAGLFVLVFGGLASGALPLEMVIPIVSVLSGVALATSGVIFGQKLLGASGAAFLLLAGPCMFLDWRSQYAVFAVAVLLGHVVPGVLLMRQERPPA